MISPLEPAVHRLLSRLESSTPRWIIALAGVPGAGKSTFAALLAEEVNRRSRPGTMVSLGMDGFHRTKQELSRLPDPAAAFARRGAPWTFDTPGMQRRLQLLRAAAGSETISWPGFQHDVGDPVDDTYTVSPSTRLVLVEGLYLLYGADGWEGTRGLFDERWYLDTPLDVAMQRLALRHMQAWKITRGQAEARIVSNDRPNAQLVLQTASSADWRLEAELAPAQEGLRD